MQAYVGDDCCWTPGRGSAASTAENPTSASPTLQRCTSFLQARYTNFVACSAASEASDDPAPKPAVYVCNSSVEIKIEQQQATHLLQLFIELCWPPLQQMAGQHALLICATSTCVRRPCCSTRPVMEHTRYKTCAGGRVWVLVQALYYSVRYTGVHRKGPKGRN